jgi:hypothetical protein
MTERMSLFDVVVADEKQNILFKRVRESRGHLPARAQLQRAYELLPSPDANFIKDFQSTGFDARVWELYLAALSDELRLSIAQPHDRPDLLLSRGPESVWVEATTANPTEGETTPTKAAGYWDEKDRIAAKLGSPLYSKLNRLYWELPHVAGLPIVLAIADFHDPDPVRSSSDPLQRYLYGYHLKLTSRPGTPVTYDLDALDTLGAKNVPAGFFALPDAKYISAVLFSNAGTVAKFSRMGFDRDLHNDIRMLRFGFSFDDDPAAIVPEPFAYIVGSAPETWGQEAVVLHNPNALHPLSTEFFEPLCQYWLVDDTFWYKAPDFMPYVSTTKIMAGKPHQMPAVEEALLREGREWVLRAKESSPAFEQALVDLHNKWLGDLSGT